MKIISIISTSIFILSLSSILWLQNSFLNLEKSLASKNKYILMQKKARFEVNLSKKMPTFGFDNLVADATFLNFIQYYGDRQARVTTGYTLVPDYFEVVVKTDPRFVHAYFLFEPATTLFAAKPDKSVDLMTKGLKDITPTQPLAFQIWFYKAITQLLFLDDIESAKKSYRTTAEWAKIQNTPQSLNTASIAEQTANFLDQKPDSRKAVASAWLSVLDNARDNQTRQIAINALKKVGAEVTITPGRISVKIPEEID